MPTMTLAAMLNYGNQFIEHWIRLAVETPIVPRVNDYLVVEPLGYCLVNSVEIDLDDQVVGVIVTPVSYAAVGSPTERSFPIKHRDHMEQLLIAKGWNMADSWARELKRE